MDQIASVVAGEKGKGYRNKREGKIEDQMHFLGIRK